ncbi:hypothetical protein KZ483_07935 [Paenibacillus sp. sptzw28]|jgi:serine/threonine-protein kinase RsbT|uniref:hypothetical protein n=1 Tax=Paenibacillus sp. sptzw28 TaxID=715179 RepID=UPI001C6E8A71|nr:hypothetical protein [Paenibacillus sp. sptzw28]QYR22854.1 hypothetical protein KZ483_07935 [Paenibacillus sp. sptzw28]
MFHIRGTTDAIIARQRGRDIAKEIGFGLVDQTIIAYTISELSLKLISFSEKGHMVIRTICKSKGEPESGIEVRLYDHYRGPSRINPIWVEKLVDDLDVTSDYLRGTMITFRKWLMSPLRIDSSICAAGEE